MKSLYKNLSGYWPFLIILALWFLFSSPYFIKGLVPFPSSYQVNFFGPWAAYPGFTSPVKNNAMPDVISQIYPWKTLTIESWKNLSVPLWNPYAFSGMPLMANYQSAVFSPLNILYFILPFIQAWSISVLLQPLLAGIFMYLCLRSFKISKEGSLIGSIAFMFCGFITTWMAYETLGYAILFLPLSIFSIQKYYLTKKTWPLVLLSVTIPLSFFSGHFQISFYFLSATVLFAVFKAIDTKNLKDFFLVLLYIFCGLFISLLQVLPSIELYLQSLRSGIFEKLEAIPFGYLPTFIAPDFLGNPVTRNDWFGHYAEWNAYIGILPLMLAFFAVLRNRTRQVWFFIILSLISVLFSFSTPFLNLIVYLKIPVISTSAASRIIVLFSLSASVLAGFGFDFFIKDLKDKNKKYVFYWVSFFMLVFLLLWGVVIFKLIIPADKILIARQNLILPTLMFGITVASAIVAFFIKHKKFNGILFLSVVFIFVVSFDLLRFANKWMPFDPQNLVYPNVLITKELNNLSGYERVYGLGQEATNYYRLSAVEGYDAVYIKRYGEFIASLYHGDLTESARSVVSLPKYGLDTPVAINLLGIKYVVNKKSDGRASWNFPYWLYAPGTFTQVYEDSAYQIFQNNSVFPRAFLTGGYKVEQNPQKILNTMFSPQFDLQKEVVLEQNINRNLDASASGSAKIVSYKPESVTIDTSSTGNTLLFLSDTYYPGWEALVDGAKTPVYRADYTFRAVYVPKGVHTVEFLYNPLSLKLGELGFVLGLAGIVFLTLIKVKKII